MTFVTVVVRGLSRRPIRAGLTLVGISIGIAAVVALVGMASGYEKGISRQLDVIGIDLVVNNMSGGIMPKEFDASLQSRIAHLPHVAGTSSVLMEMLSIEDAHAFRDRTPVDGDVVRAPEILDQVLIEIDVEKRMPRRDPVAFHDDVRMRVAADHIVARRNSAPDDLDAPHADHDLCLG